jgi:hypothetical protein
MRESAFVDEIVLGLWWDFYEFKSRLVALALLYPASSKKSDPRRPGSLVCVLETRKTSFIMSFKTAGTGKSVEGKEKNRPEDGLGFVLLLFQVLLLSTFGRIDL